MGYVVRVGRKVTLPMRDWTAAWRLKRRPFKRGRIPEKGRIATMTRIRTVPMSEADEKLRRAIGGTKGIYPKEDFVPGHPGEPGGSTVGGLHPLITGGLYHSFATFGAPVSAEWPLARRQH